jgi:RimJ/RimL family protein N-acetyltransferase
LLETERLVLRLPRLEDAAGVLEFVADPDVMRWLDGEPGDIEVAAAKIGRWLDCWERNGVGPFAVERDGRFVGRVGFLVWDAHVWDISSYTDAMTPVTELGWTFARTHWGLGYATEAALAVRAWGHARGIGEQVSLLHPENPRSMRVAEKLGAAPAVTIELMGSSAVIWRHPPGQLPAR